MIKVKVKHHDDKFKEITISGHADSGPRGQDLICAGVSAVSIGVLNTLAKREFEERNLGIIKIKEGYINIIIKQYDHDCQVVLETLMTTLISIAESNGKYIKISNVEV